MIGFVEMPYLSPVSRRVRQECDFRTHSGRWAPLGYVMIPIKLLQRDVGMFRLGQSYGERSKQGSKGRGVFVECVS